MTNCLSLCSLCGGKPLIRSKDPVHRSSYRFRCTGCGLTVNKGYNTREEAINAWEQLHASKLVSIDNYQVPQGYTIIPSNLFSEVCLFIRSVNEKLFMAITKYDICQRDTPETDQIIDPMNPLGGAELPST
jgi:hypothetical protein